MNLSQMSPGKFHYRLLLVQTIIYGLLYSVRFTDGMTEDGIKVYGPVVIVFYLLSVLFTVIIPLLLSGKDRS